MRHPPAQMEPEERARRAYAYENPRPEVAALVPGDARRILDLGCSSGALGAALRARPAAPEVVGIERDPVYAERARERLDDVLEDDLERLAGDPAALEGLGSFDVVVAADVLEHLVEPWAVLRAFAGRLAPGGAGRVVLSVPNVRHWETFWQLGRHGSWPRRSEGLFDATHLRWFGLADVHALLGEAGLEVEHLERSFRVRRGASAWDARAARVAPGIPGARTLLTLQHLVRARPV